MVNVVATSKQLRMELEDVVNRTNEKIHMTNMLPKEITKQMDMEIFDDMEFLLRYINALHNLLEDLAEKETDTGGAFEF